MKAGHKKPGPKKGWKLKGMRKAVEQRRASRLKRNGASPAKRAAKRDSLRTSIRNVELRAKWAGWFHALALTNKNGVILNIGRGKALLVKAVTVS